ncbi:TusE/DsrC/DsvC family sulfur relay protein [Reinekea sp.]|jgi:tRNA 2-thiouridine synthesizing protein E|uniref:TusE/DsrC/DsvC family sulfur relay protein n=1 Tax=Reinekea sp. TaxID=1970455 RepID=UPI00398997B6
MTQSTNEQGFLLDFTQWTETWAQQVAKENNLTLDSIDLSIIAALRGFYIEFDLSPPMRPLVKLIKTKVNLDYGNSIWLMQRYGESPARVLALLAGLPKPKNCL